jgi:ferredoxin
MKVFIKSDKCLRCGACEVLTNGAICSPGDKAAFLNLNINLDDPETIDNITIAADTCPQKAIIIEK